MTATTELTLEQLADHARRTGDVAARNEVIERCLPLLHRIATKIHKRLIDSVDHDDLVQAGVFGLIGAIERFDISRGHRFPTFAGFRVVGAMYDEIREADNIARLTRTRTKMVAMAENMFFTTFGYPPNHEELRERMRLDQRSFERVYRDQAVQVSSMSSPSLKGWGDEDDGRLPTLGDSLVDRNAVPIGTGLDAAEIVGFVRDAFGSRTALMVRLYYLESWTMNRIAEHLGVTESAISNHLKIVRQASYYRFNKSLREAA